VSQKPLISVCIPCYNGAEFIGRTLESVLAQTFTDFELILTDDNSTDETVSIINGFSDPRIRLIRNEHNLGLGLNWKRVLSQAVGKYVKLLCEDDLLHPECLARQVGVLEHSSNSRVALAVCNRKVINGSDEVILSRRLPFPSGLVSGASLIRKSVRWGTNLIGEPAVGLFRRDAMDPKEACHAANAYLSDLALWAQLLRHGDAFVDEEYLAAFRISRGAATSRIGSGQAASFRNFVRTLHQDSFYRISMFDITAGYMLSLQWCVIRNLFIHLHSRRTGSKPSAMRLSHDSERCSSSAAESGSAPEWCEPAPRPRPREGALVTLA
jgi:glycosyltransferase involved in cell wall biosynthesis